MIMNETINTIMSRRSVRAYKSDLIPQDVLSAILEAGQAAPYVMPDSRHFSVIQDKALITKLRDAAKIEGMKISDMHKAMFSARGFDGTYGAPVVVILSGKEDSVQYEAVCAASAQNMLIAAQSLGISSCWAYFPIFVFHGADMDKWRKTLQIPNGFKPCGTILLGYGADAPDIDNEQDKRYKNSISYIENNGAI